MANNSQYAWHPSQTQIQDLTNQQAYLLSLKNNNLNIWQQYYDQFKQYTQRHNDLQGKAEYKAERKELRQQIRDMQTQCAECKQFQESIDAQLLEVQAQLPSTEAVVFKQASPFVQR